MTALAVTDHGNMCATVEFHKECISRGVKPIIGCEFYVASGTCRDRASRDLQTQVFHVVLLAESPQGYRNLCLLNSVSHMEGCHRKPCISPRVPHQGR